MEETKFMQRLRVAKLVAGTLAAITATALLAYKLITGTEWLSIVMSFLTGLAG